MAQIKSSYFKCLVAKEFRWLYLVDQGLIIMKFNEEVFEMPAREIAYCLEVISEF